MSSWIEDVDYYINEEGLIVLTEKFHRDRGYCCGNGCKHCPFDYKSVPEPKRSEMRSRNARSHQDESSSDDSSTTTYDE